MRKLLREKFSIAHSQECPRRRHARPTSDRLRETLFDILQSRIAGTLFMDAYAGTGAVGIGKRLAAARRTLFSGAQSRCDRDDPEESDLAGSGAAVHRSAPVRCC